ncbi:MAG: hypothetical protein K5765_09175 [Clostridia bacterium]|nr:hypothetical protein [Clostridia bacterium]
MKKIGLKKDFISNELVILDENFVKKYLPDADENYVKVYVYGLFLANKNISSDFVETISENLKISKDIVNQAINYWENLGLMDQINVDEYVYNSAKNPIRKAIKYDPKKYGEFTRTVNTNYPELDIKYNQYNLLYEFMEEEKFGTDSMILVIEHCKSSPNYKFNVSNILTLAKSCANEGRRKPNQVGDKLKEIEIANSSLSELFSAMGIKSWPDAKDKEIFDNWIKYGYSLNTILIAARSLKKGSMEKLDSLMNNLKNANAFTPFEITDYINRFEESKKTAIYVSKKLSDFVDSDTAVSEYIDRWLSLGYSFDSIKGYSDMCFKRGIKGYQTMNNMIDSLFEAGIFSDENVNEHIKKNLLVDKNIAKIKTILDLVPNVTDRDRTMYQNWCNWNIPFELVIKVADEFKGYPYPLNKMNIALAEIKNLGYQNDSDMALKEIEKIKNTNQKFSKNGDFDKHEYNEDDYNSMLADLDAIIENNDDKKKKD